MGDSLQYHLLELEVARDPSNRAHLMPPLKPHYRVILDVGCGMGQTLIAAGLPPDVTAYGVDRDAAAIEAGRRIAPANIHLSAGAGKKLEFADDFFDYAICRVALPYMRIGVALAEMFRVLKPGGEVWLALHPPAMHRARAIRSLRQGQVRDVLYCALVAVNSLLFNSTGKQLVIGNTSETFQTEHGMRRALERCGFEGIEIRHQASFVAEARKPTV
ncbi:MAG TPA: class I SAM-dependent methyltransferase [Candidatus Binatia bacterium]|nr:class I SAM-dependent methyltransferase [Candidatus Binatia bacterium]